MSSSGTWRTSASGRPSGRKQGRPIPENTKTVIYVLALIVSGAVLGFMVPIHGVPGVPGPAGPVGHTGPIGPAGNSTVGPSGPPGPVGNYAYPIVSKSLSRVSGYGWNVTWLDAQNVNTLNVTVSYSLTPSTTVVSAALRQGSSAAYVECANYCVLNGTRTLLLTFSFSQVGLVAGGSYALELRGYDQASARLDVVWGFSL